jgi:hypothetical protein
MIDPLTRARPAAVAISEGPSSGSISVAAIDPARRTFVAKNVDVQNLSLAEIEASFQTPGLCPYRELRDELSSVVGGAETRVCVALVPSVFLEANSSLAKGIVLLAAFGFGSLQFGRATVDGIDRFFLGIDPPIIGGADVPPNLPSRILWAYTDPIRAYGDFRFGHRPSGRVLAATCAACACSPGLFYFLTSGGDPQSSQDLVEFLKARDRMKSLGINTDAAIVHGVVSGTEQYSLAATTSTRFDDEQRLPIKYALTAKRFEWLEPRHARKLAVLAICKEWRIRLSCSSLRDEHYASLTVSSLEKHCQSNDESTRHLAALLKEHHDANEVAPGFKSAYLLSMYRALAEAGIFPNELELRLLGLGRDSRILDHHVYDPESDDLDWAFQHVCALPRELQPSAITGNADGSAV